RSAVRQTPLERNLRAVRAVLDAGGVHRGLHDQDAAAAARVRRRWAPDAVVLDHDLQDAVLVVEGDADRSAGELVAVLDRVDTRLVDGEHGVIARVLAD